MFYYVASYYLVLKAVFFFSLVRIQIKFETMKDHWLFLGYPLHGRHRVPELRVPL